MNDIFEGIYKAGQCTDLNDCKHAIALTKERIKFGEGHGEPVRALYRRLSSLEKRFSKLFPTQAPGTVALKLLAVDFVDTKYIDPLDGCAIEKAAKREFPGLDISECLTSLRVGPISYNHPYYGYFYFLDDQNAASGQRANKIIRVITLTKIKG